MLDSSRHFQTVDEIRRWLDLMAMHKLNVFHWHLVDDHGWRFESKTYPLLTQVGAWREQPPIGRYGGFYTQAELRDVVAYAASLGISMLFQKSKCWAIPARALAAYPNLACGGTRTEVDHFFDLLSNGRDGFSHDPRKQRSLRGQEGNLPLFGRHPLRSYGSLSRARIFMSAATK